MILLQLKVDPMTITAKLQELTVDAVKELYEIEISPQDVLINQTRREFEGEYSIVVFPFVKAARRKPEDVGTAIGKVIKTNSSIVADFNVVKGFLNISLTSEVWTSFLKKSSQDEDYGFAFPSGRKVMVEYSSPNTNKPLHLGHIRNNLLGHSVSEILKACGHQVVKTQIINDRGIHICKSMLAWQRYGDGETPESSGLKGDHLIGKYYVKFNTVLKEQKAAIGPDAKDDDTEIMQATREMLIQWEQGDDAVLKLWKKMNGWVYDGFNETYARLGVEFDKNYFESKTYLEGKTMVQAGLDKGIFYKEDDGSVWCDLEDVGLDKKIVQRSDGTSVYMTQDLGTARLRYEEFGSDGMVYVVGNEQDYHFKVLFEILKKLEEPYAEQLHHLSYGMVNLPEGKMKSREGTVVDADDLMDEVIQEARIAAQERSEEAVDDENIQNVGLSALKFFILKVSPKKTIVFDPKASVDLQGHTGPYIQNAYVRIQSILRKSGMLDMSLTGEYTEFQDAEKHILVALHEYPRIIQAAGAAYDPAIVANFCYDLAKLYHKFYHDCRILTAESDAAKSFRLNLSQLTAHALKNGCSLLGIEMPERM